MFDIPSTTDLTPWIFGAIMAGGLLYLLVSLIFGNLLDADFDSVDTDSSISEARGLGCSVLSAGLAGFGSGGLLGTASGWGIPLSIVVGVVLGLAFWRGTLWALQFVLRQQHSSLMTTESLIGTSARITINIPAGKVGEAIVETDSLIKYPTQAINPETELHKGDYVEVVDVRQGRLYVKKKYHTADELSSI